MASSILPALIPLRDSKSLTDLDRIYQYKCSCNVSCISHIMNKGSDVQMHNNDPNVEQNTYYPPFIPLVHNLESPTQVLGRFDVFLSTWTACSCIITASNESLPRPNCESCKQKAEWAKLFISRKFLQFELNSNNGWIWKLSPVGMNASALVRMNGIPLEQEQRSNHETIQTRSYPLKMGSILSICPSTGDESLSYNFRVGWVKITKDVSHDSRIMLITDPRATLTSYKIAEDSIPVTDELSILSTTETMDPMSKTDDKKLDTDEERVHVVVEPSVLIATETMDPTSKMDEKKLDKTKNFLPSSRANAGGVNLTSKNSTVEDIVDVSQAPGIKMTTVYLLPLGRSMTNTRVENITKDIQNKHKAFQILPSFDINHPPNIVVVDASLNAAQVALALGFAKSEEFHSYLKEHEIHTVIPTWIVKIIKCKRSSDVPTFEFCWPGIYELDKKAKLPPGSAPGMIHCTGWLTKRKKSLEMNPLTFVKASTCSDPIIQRELKRRKESIQEESQGTAASELKLVRVPSSSSYLVDIKYPRNEELASLMNQISTLYQECPLQESDEWRSYTYKTAAGRLLYLDFEVDKDPNVLSKLRSMRGFGPKVIECIEDYLKFNKCSMIEAMQKDPRRAAVKNLIGIWGIGPTKALSLVDLGYKNIEDVRKGIRTGRINLTENIRIGVDCYEDFSEKIDRDEVAIIGKIVADTLHERFPRAIVSIMGSYRRGKSKCGDVDVLIVDPEFVEATPIGALDWLVELLRQRRHITHHLTSVDADVFKRIQKGSSNADSYDECFIGLGGSASYMGVFSSPLHASVRRRIDIKFYPLNEQATAMLYFTGSGFFNRCMRLYAKRKCFHLDDHGLYVVSAADKRGKKLIVRTELDVFNALGLEYKEPHERESFEAIKVKGAQQPIFIENSEQQLFF